VTKALTKCVETFMVISFIFLIGITFMQVLSRYIFSFSFAWSEELTRYIFVWMIFVGASLGFRYKSHIALDLVLSLMPPLGRRIMEFINAVAILVLLGVLIYYGWNTTLVAMKQNSPALYLPMGYVYASIPIGSVVTAIFILTGLRTKHDLKSEVADH